jgi:hypothetical protein
LGSLEHVMAGDLGGRCGCINNGDEMMRFHRQWSRPMAMAYNPNISLEPVITTVPSLEGF